MGIITRDLRRTVIYWSGMMGNPITNVEVFLDEEDERVFVDTENLLLCIEGVLLNVPIGEAVAISVALELINAEKVVIEPHGTLHDITDAGGGFAFMKQQEAGPGEETGTFA